MEYNAISNLEKDLLKVLKEEYSFYQSMYILIDKQKDLLRFDKDEKLLDIYTEIENCHKRILESENKISKMKRDNAKLFNLAASAPEIKKVAQCIVTLIRKNLDLVRQNEDYAQQRYSRLKKELKDLQHSSNLVKYIKDLEIEPQFVDKKN